MYTSAQSYAVFKTRAWNLLNDNAYANASMSVLENDLYDNCYSRPKVNAAASNKTALSGRALALKMEEICDEYGAARRVYNQSLDQDINVPTLQEEYENRAAYLNINILKRIFCCCCYCGFGELSDDAVSSTTAYLHAFPNPARGRIDTNWRLVANVKPNSLNTAVRRACAIMDANNAVDEFKISAPGYVGKPDSVIIYMLNANASYGNIRDAFTQAMNVLDIQETSAPMVNELFEGIGECSEPPKIRLDNPNYGQPNQPQYHYHQFSFGTYRCFLTGMAFRTALAAAGDLDHLTQHNFDTQLDTTFDNYGVPHGNPHRQNQINWNNGDPEYTDFMNALDNYYGLANGTVGARNAIFDNPPAIV